MTRKTSMIVFALLFVTALGISEAHSDCKTIGYSAIQTGYIYQDFGVWGNRKPVLQRGATVTCGGLSLDLWTSAGLTGNGKFGRRGGEDEGDLTLFYNNKVGTPLGDFRYEIGGAYYALGYGGGLTSTRDDVANFYAQVGRPFEIQTNLGAISLTPFVRPSLYRHMSGPRNDMVIRSGIEFSIPLSPWLNFEGDVSIANLVTGKRQTVFRPSARLVANVGDGWSANVGVKGTDRTGNVFLLGLAKHF